MRDFFLKFINRSDNPTFNMIEIEVRRSFRNEEVL